MITDFRNLKQADDLPPNFGDPISYKFNGETYKTRWGDRELFDRMLDTTKNTVITKLQFRRLFPAQSIFIIDNFEDPSFGFSSVQVQTLRTIKESFNSALDIDLNDPDVIMALNVFVGFTIMNETDKNFVLSNGGV